MASRVYFWNCANPGLCPFLSSNRPLTQIIFGKHYKCEKFRHMKVSSQPGVLLKSDRKSGDAWFCRINSLANWSREFGNQSISNPNVATDWVPCFSVHALNENRLKKKLTYLSYLQSNVTGFYFSLEWFCSNSSDSSTLQFEMPKHLVMNLGPTIFSVLSLNYRMFWASMTSMFSFIQNLLNQNGQAFCQRVYCLGL